MTRLRFNTPTLMGDELAHVRTAIESGHTAMDGPFTTRVRDLLRDALGAADVILTTSCTDALELSALVLAIRPGDVVIVPSFTFVSTASAFVRAGASLRFADIDTTSLTMDPTDVHRLMDERVRAVVPVHYGGIAADMDGIAAAVDGVDRAVVVEDNAHGLFATTGGRVLGSFGRMSTLSFHETKNFTCGEGGALVLNDPDDVEVAHVLKDKGTDRRAFFRGDVDRYSWQEVGSSFGMSDILAAFLYGQLEQRDAVIARRRQVFDGYMVRLAPHAQRLGLRLPVVPLGDQPGYHLFHVIVPDGATRDRCLRDLAAQRIQATFHYVPLHSSVAGRRHADGHQSCPVTVDVSQRLLRLPFHNGMSDDDLDRVCDALVGALGRRHGSTRDDT